MLIKEIREIAKGLGVKCGKLKKSDLIRAIQLHEGNFDCFGSATDGYCDQDSCLWREDCLPPEETKPRVKRKTPVKKKAPAKKKSVAKKKSPVKKKK